MCNTEKQFTNKWYDTHIFYSFVYHLLLKFQNNSNTYIYKHISNYIKYEENTLNKYINIMLTSSGLCLNYAAPFAPRSHCWLLIFDQFKMGFLTCIKVHTWFIWFVIEILYKIFGILLHKFITTLINKSILKLTESRNVKQFKNASYSGRWLDYIR